MWEWKFQVFWFPLLAIIGSSVGSTEWFNEKLKHVPAHVTQEDLTYLAGLSNEELFNKTLSKIAIPRVMGTRGHDAVKNFIVDSMESLKWDVQLDSFTENTIIGRFKFENIVATLDPKARRHLVLACHYDSKMDREKALVLATDSAVPCSMMINLAQLLDSLLKGSKTQTNEVTLQLIFFDGEEAFLQWTETDSIYGARHLARVLSNKSYPENSNDNTNHLHRMDVIVLLDLLGYRDPTFANFFSETSHLYSKIKDIERALNEQGLIKTSSKPYFTDRQVYSGVEDDHLPFLHRGVHILHLIPVPFPSVWHKETDIVDNLDFKSIDNLNKILRTFVVSYLHLNASTI